MQIDMVIIFGVFIYSIGHMISFSEFFFFFTNGLYCTISDDKGVFTFYLIFTNMCSVANYVLRYVYHMTIFYSPNHM